MQLNREDLYKVILDNLPEGVNVIDANGYIVYANHSSVNYARAVNAAEMIGKHITEYYSKAALLEVIGTQKSLNDVKITHANGRTFITNAFPVFFNEHFYGGVATFRDITEIEELSKRLESLEIELVLSQGSDVFDLFIGKSSSLKTVIDKAQRSMAAIGGPRHSIILGETGTGKTMLAKAMYYFAKKIRVLKPDAPFIEVNCAQFTNSDIAAMEVFGTERGAYTGATDKPGLVELANKGVLFLDEAHALVQHQTMLLKLIESGTVRRMGGRTERELDLIIIAASTRNLKKEFLPELYQRLAQYQIDIPPLRERSGEERETLLNFFVRQYMQRAKERNDIELQVAFAGPAKEILLRAKYERNIRQFRDVVFASIDAAAPLVSSLPDGGREPLRVTVQPGHIPFSMLETDSWRTEPVVSHRRNDAGEVAERIKEFRQKGLGPRKIAAELKKQGHDIEYYQVAYALKKSETGGGAAPAKNNG
ncbi:MAG TPA: sigma 54-interacting transcriptional regulator [Patescibacteria group bacterium]|nr:sigma 54-interacting transcriptional regulator [Patescibacteria group bacterium]